MQLPPKNDREKAPLDRTSKLLPEFPLSWSGAAMESNLKITSFEREN